jgi:hypothetical protein
VSPEGRVPLVVSATGRDRAMIHVKWLTHATFLMVGGLGLLLAAPSVQRQDPLQNPAPFSDWDYPIRLGDPRSRVREVLGRPSCTRDGADEYWAAFVTVWFDADDRVTKLNLRGAAGLITSGCSLVGAQGLIVAPRVLMFGLMGDPSADEFSRLLGPPVREERADSGARLSMRRVWITSGYVIDALFLTADWTDRSGQAFSAGRLLWFDVSVNVEPLTKRLKPPQRSS